MIVLDTSVLLYWTLDKTKLSQNAGNSIEEADRILVSSISIWEIELKVKLNKLEIPFPINVYVEQLMNLERLEIIPVDTQNWLENLDLPWEHRDPADRTIVALANRHDCPLVSSDRIVAEYYKETIW